MDININEQDNRPIEYNYVLLEEPTSNSNGNVEDYS